MVVEPSNAGGGKKGKKKDEGPLEVVISSVARTKKKFVTNVTGLSRFGIKLVDASRVFAKRFAAASSATPDKDEITIQGEVVESLAEFILKQWPVRTSPFYFEVGAWPNLASETAASPFQAYPASTNHFAKYSSESCRIR